ncbi:DUF4158 domain-containing protein [Peribacillus simplex]
MLKVVIEYIAKQLDVSPDRFDEYSWGGKEKAYTRHHQNIRNLFSFRELIGKDNDSI